MFTPTPSTIVVTQSSLMTAFNLARNCKQLDAKRVRRAFALIQRKTTYAASNRALNIPSSTRPGLSYTATLDRCCCEDSRSGNICKHRIAAALYVKAQRIAQGAQEKGGS